MLNREMRAAFVVVLAWSGQAIADWRSIRFEPADIAFPSQGTSQRFIVTATDPGGNEVDVTDRCRVTASNPRMIEVDQKKAVIIAKAPGQTQLQISLENVKSSIRISVGDRPVEMTVNFSPDVISILTTKGCNSSSCHGSPAGQNGFKLSLFGYDTGADYQMIVKAREGRRVSLQEPRKSLLLQKPSFAIPHGGGRVLPPDSDEYQTLLTWLRQGAKADSSGVRLARLEIYPTERILPQGARQRLAVIGRLSDGTTRDMTREVRWIMGDEAVVKTSPDALATADSPGLATVTARAMGQVATAQFGVIQAPPGSDHPSIPTNNFVDDLVFAKLRRMNMTPADLSSDREFIRRVYLDAIGMLPAADAVRDFSEDTRLDKRSRVIDVLLDRPEYVSHWTVKFEDWFRNCQLNSTGRSMGTFRDWIREWIARDRPYDQVVRELLTSKGDVMLNPATVFWSPAADFVAMKLVANKVTPTISRLFLGIRLECAECHNHPLENYTQDDFYGLSAFFSRLRVKHGYGEYRRTWFLDTRSELEHPVTKMAVRPKFLGGQEPEIEGKADRRKILADWITSPQNPFFSRATVNRFWHEYFEAGIVEPFDDFRSTNMPTNPELLDRLARYFVDGGFRLKALHRVILNSRTYQLSSEVRKPTPDGPKTPSKLRKLLFAGYSARKLPAEVLMDAIAQVTGVSQNFAGYPKGTSAKDLYVPDNPDYFLVTFGFPRRDILADRTKTPSLSQALHLMNGETVREKVMGEENIIGQMLAKGLSSDQIVSILYERAYSRPPSAGEVKENEEFARVARANGIGPRQYLGDLLWAILNSKEFQLNH